jgi:hypothetical protein
MAGSEDGDDTNTLPDDTYAVQYKLHEEDGRIVAITDVARSESCPSESMVSLALLGRVYRVR